MSMELLQSIDQAEAKAEEIRAGAQREAREIIKGVEDACVTQERAAVLEQRTQAQQVVEEARDAATRHIEAAAKDEATARARTTDAARQKLDAAANHIFERVVHHGHR